MPGGPWHAPIIPRAPILPPRPAPQIPPKPASWRFFFLIALLGIVLPTVAGVVMLGLLLAEILGWF